MKGLLKGDSSQKLQTVSKITINLLTMLWFLFTFSSAFFESVKNVFSKKSLENVDEYLVVWLYSFFAVLFLAPLLFFVEIPSLENRFWVALFIGGCLNIITTILYIKAIKASAISKTVPLTCFTPVFVVIFSPFLLGEHSTFFDIIGIFTVVTGAYVLNNNEVGNGYLYPLKAILKEKGSKLMLCVTFLWGLSSVVDKIGVQSSSPIFWILAIYIFITLATFPITLYKSRTKLKEIQKSWKYLLFIGLLVTLTETFQMIAISLTFVSRVEALKLTNVLMTVLFDYIIFKEKDIKQRLVGTAIMIVGVLFIILSK